MRAAKEDWYDITEGHMEFMCTTCKAEWVLIGLETTNGDTCEIEHWRSKVHDY